jgi:ATP-dependent exoDNAse (exonuclease V) beta subunit
MSENFRCDKTVIDFVNAVFDRLLGVAGESIGYRPEDRLTFAKARIDGAEPIPAVLAVFHKEKAAAEEEKEAWSQMQ